MAYKIKDHTHPERGIKFEKAQRALAIAVTSISPEHDPAYYTVLLRPEMVYKLGKCIKTESSFFIHRVVVDKNSGGETFIVKLHGNKSGDSYVLCLESMHGTERGKLEVSIPRMEAEAIGDFLIQASHTLFLAALWGQRDKDFLSAFTPPSKQDQ